jgi:hypothetical protein
MPAFLEVVPPAFSKLRADALASELEVGLDVGICLACLSFVSSAIDRGDPRDVAREVRRMTPDLWAEGLAEPSSAAIRRAAERGVPDADAALHDLELNGGRSAIARSIVHRLARELSERVHRDLRLEARARETLARTTPELN